VRCVRHRHDGDGILDGEGGSKKLDGEDERWHGFRAMVLLFSIAAKMETEKTESVVFCTQSLADRRRRLSDETIFFRNRTCPVESD